MDKAIREALKGSFSDRKLVLEYAFGKVQTEVKIDTKRDEPISVFEFVNMKDSNTFIDEEDSITRPSER